MEVEGSSAWHTQLIQTIVNLGHWSSICLCGNKYMWHEALGGSYNLPQKQWINNIDNATPEVTQGKKK